MIRVMKMGHAGPVSLCPPPERSGDLVSLYNRLAPRYDVLHRRWLRAAGGEAQAALEAATRVVATPDSTLLDAGCGTGAFVRRLVAEGRAPHRMTVLDPSAAMLDRCSDLPVQRVTGRLEALPFSGSQFDVVTCAWALETVANLDLALAELCRVVRPRGALCLAFCAQKPADGFSAWLMKNRLLALGSGHFLPVRAVVTVLESEHGFRVQGLPCRGPAAALFAWRPDV